MSTIPATFEFTVCFSVVVMLIAAIEYWGNRKENK